MLRRTLSSLASESKILNSDQENELSFDPTNLPTPSPNRSKYEGKFVKAREDRRPFGEKTNKLNKIAEGSDKSSRKMKDNNSSDKNGAEDNMTAKEKSSSSAKSSDTNTNSNTSTTSNNDSSSSFNEIFHLNGSKVEELTMALSETLKENEELYDTVSLLKAEIERLNEELLEYKEYAELYLLGKELIENQAEEIENLKKKLVKRE